MISGTLSSAHVWSYLRPEKSDFEQVDGLDKGPQSGIEGDAL
ncbi:MAG: hypothetical protein ABSF53_19685 [Terracidiphilus sp.]|jgi:hypothetical protein